MPFRIIVLSVVLFGLVLLGSQNKTANFTPNDIMQAILGLALFIGIIYLYCLPSIIADKRKHKNRNAISTLNLFLGWTFIGWVVALTWANTANVEK